MAKIQFHDSSMTDFFQIKICIFFLIFLFLLGKLVTLLAVQSLVDRVRRVRAACDHFRGLAARAARLSFVRDSPVLLRVAKDRRRGLWCRRLFKPIL